MIRKRLRRLKIITRLTVSHSLVSVSIVILFNILSYYMFTSYMAVSSDEQIMQVEQWIVSNIESEDLRHSESFYMDTYPYKSTIYIRLVGENNEILDQSPNFDFSVLTDKKEGKPFYFSETGTYINYRTIEEQSKRHGNLKFIIVKDFSGVYVLFNKILITITGFSAFGIVLTFFVSYRITKKSLKPIQDIADFANESNLSLEKRLPKTEATDEMQYLINSVNSLMDRLQSAVEKQVQFVSDASHELKTPTTAILGYANLIERWGREKQDVLVTSIAAIKRESEAMRELVDKLLLLAKYDNGALMLEKDAFCINDIIDEVIHEARLLYPNHLFSTARADTAFLQCDYKLIKQLLRILADNSTKFSDAGSKVDISAVVKGTQVTIYVSDNGYGIAKDEIEKLFDRFFCSELSRVKNISGNGLGLSIAKKIVELHNGCIVVESSLGMGTAVQVTLQTDHTSYGT